MSSFLKKNVNTFLQIVNVNISPKLTQKEVEL